VFGLLHASCSLHSFDAARLSPAVERARNRPPIVNTSNSYPLSFSTYKTIPNYHTQIIGYVTPTVRGGEKLSFWSTVVPSWKPFVRSTGLTATSFKAGDLETGTWTMSLSHTRL
jgi:hypothetical protein